MQSLDVLYFSLSIGFLVLAGFISFAAFQLAQTLKSARLLIMDAKDIVKDVQAVKDGVTRGILQLISSFFRRKKD